MYVFEKYPDKKGEWRWRLVAANGRKVGDSGEGYTREADVDRAIRAFVAGVGKAVRAPRRTVR